MPSSQDGPLSEKPAFAHTEAEAEAAIQCEIIESFWEHARASLRSLRECWSFVQACTARGRDIAEPERCKVDDRFHAAIVSLESQESAWNSFAGQVGASLRSLPKLLEITHRNGINLDPALGSVIDGASAELRWVTRSWQEKVKAEWQAFSGQSQQDASASEYITISKSEAAKKIERTVRTLNRWIAKGIVDASEVNKDLIRVKASDLYPR